MLVDWRRNAGAKQRPPVANTIAPAAIWPESGVVRAGMIVLALLMVICGLTLEFALAGSLQQARRSADWPTTNGNMIEVRADEGTRGRRRSAPTYLVFCRYRYAVDDIGYTGTRISFQQNSMSQAEAEQFLKDHRRGAIVKVFYDPADPSESTLRAGATAWQYSGVFLFGPAMILGGAYGLYYLTLKRRLASR
jgi:hypothetical protein